jgi:hypothetical protein
MHNFIQQIWPRPRGYWDKKKIINFVERSNTYPRLVLVGPVISENSNMWKSYRWWQWTQSDDSTSHDLWIRWAYKLIYSYLIDLTRLGNIFLKSLGQLEPIVDMYWIALQSLWFFFSLVLISGIFCGFLNKIPCIILSSRFDLGLVVTGIKRTNWSQKRQKLEMIAGFILFVFIGISISSIQFLRKDPIWRVPTGLL